MAHISFHDLSRLRLFTLLASSRNLAAVSMAEGLTPDQVKRAVKMFESNIQKTLLRFHGGRISLTESGHDLFERSWPLIQSIELTAGKILDPEQWKTRRLVIGLSGCNRWMIPVIHKFSERYPDIPLKITAHNEAMGSSAYCPDICIDCSEDAAAHHSPTLDTFWFESLHVMRPELTSPEDISGYVSAEGLRLIKTGGKDQSRPDDGQKNCPPIIETVSLDMAYEFALSGAGIAKLPEFMVRDDLVTGRLIQLDKLPESVYVSLYASMRKRNTGYVQAFIDFMRVAVPFYLNKINYYS